MIAFSYLKIQLFVKLLIKLLLMASVGNSWAFFTNLCRRISLGRQRWRLFNGHAHSNVKIKLSAQFLLQPAHSNTKFDLSARFLLQPAHSNVKKDETRMPHLLFIDPTHVLPVGRPFHYILLLYGLFLFGNELRFAALVL